MKHRILVAGASALCAIFLFSGVVLAAKSIITRDIWATVAGANNQVADIYRISDDDNGIVCYVTFFSQAQLKNANTVCVHK